MSIFPGGDESLLAPLLAGALPHDWSFVGQLIVERRSVRAGVDIVREGEAGPILAVLADGWAMRYRRLDDGRRQIFEFLLPGDLVGLQTVLLGASRHAVRTITAATLLVLCNDFVERMTGQRGGVAVALLRWLALRERRADVRLAALGSRGAAQRIGHLMLDIADRLKHLGLADGQTYSFPLQRQHLGDALDISRNHVKRSLELLEAKGLATLAARTLRVLDGRALARYVELPFAEGAPSAAA
jgi:CRP-like cAMP-binding protein